MKLGGLYIVWHQVSSRSLWQKGLKGLKKPSPYAFSKLTYKFYSGTELLDKLVRVKQELSIIVSSLVQLSLNSLDPDPPVKAATIYSGKKRKETHIMKRLGVNSKHVLKEFTSISYPFLQLLDWGKLKLHKSLKAPIVNSQYCWREEP